MIISTLWQLRYLYLYNIYKIQIVRERLEHVKPFYFNQPTHVNQPEQFTFTQQTFSPLSSSLLIHLLLIWRLIISLLTSLASVLLSMMLVYCFHYPCTIPSSGIIVCRVILMGRYIHVYIHQLILTFPLSTCWVSIVLCFY